MPLVECAICEKEIEQLQSFNGTILCEECYVSEENQIYNEDEVIA